MLRLDGRKDEALDALTRAVDAESDFMPALYEQGMVFAEKGQWEKALANFERFSHAHPQDENARIAIQKIKQELGRTNTL
jgi:tetratricopeptide (TPR) repeat protein